MKNESKTIVCKNCNNTIPKGVRVCPFCGTKIQKPFYSQWWFILLLIVAVISSLIAISISKRNNLDWSDIVLADYLPEPKSNEGKINYNSEENLSVYIYDTFKDEYKEYMSECKTFGYIQESVIDGNSYSAFSNEGYKLSLRLDEKDEEMSINLEAPMELGILRWSESEMAKLIPKPKSKVGKIENDDKKIFKVYIGETSIDDFNEYITLCMQNGFNIEVKENEKSFSAKNSDSYKLTVEYLGNNIISIIIQEPEFDVEIEVICRENAVFSKYDIKIIIDDTLEDSVIHGKTKILNYVLTKGIHTVKFVSCEDNNILKIINIDISKDEKYKFEVLCTNSEINVKTILGTIYENNNDSFEKETTNETQTVKDEENEVVDDVIYNTSNCKELSSLLKLKNENDPKVAEFANKYKGEKIEFDANVAFVSPHGDYNTRFDYLIYSGDYSTSKVRGPNFQFEDVNYYDLNLKGENVPDKFGIGLNFHLIAEVEEYDSVSGLFKLKPIEITMR